MYPVWADLIVRDSNNHYQICNYLFATLTEDMNCLRYCDGINYFSKISAEGSIRHCWIEIGRLILDKFLSNSNEFLIRL